MEQLPLKRSPGSPDSFLLKRARFDPTSNTEYTPTPVLFVRGLTPSVTEKDIVALCSQVGVLRQLQLLRNKGQAFVEFDSLEAADFCLLHFAKYPAFLFGNKLSFSYSGRQQIAQQPVASQPCTELILTISHVKYPVNAEVLDKIFMPYGRIRRSLVFPRSGGFQCVVQLESLDAAKAAKEELEGKQIYNECNLIATEYSPMHALLNANEEEYSRVVFIHQLGAGATADMLFNLFSLYGNVLRVKIFQKRPDMALIEYEDHQQALNAKNNLDNVTVLGSKMLVSISRNNFINKPKFEHKDLCKVYNSSFHRYKLPGSKNFHNMFPPSNVLHLSNLCEGMREHVIISMFETKILAFKYIGEGRKMALAKFRSVEDAINVIMRHHNRNVNGRFIKIAFSKAIF